MIKDESIKSNVSSERNAAANSSFFSRLFRMKSMSSAGERLDLAIDDGKEDTQEACLLADNADADSGYKRTLSAYDLVSIFCIRQTLLTRAVPCF